MSVCLKAEYITNLIDRSIRAAIEAAQYLPSISQYERPEATHKGVHREEVTQYDAELEKIILQDLLSSHEDEGFLGEESGHIEGSSTVKWIVDPIDGTPNFIRQIPAFAISIAAEIDGLVVAGVVYDPSHKEIFSAGLGLGAQCNGFSISSSVTNNLSEAIISTGFSKQTLVRKQQAKLFSRILTRVRDIRSSGSAALDLCWVAAGRLDGYYEHDLQYWDLAAGALIASEAGAKVRIKDDFIVGVTRALSDQFYALF